MKIQQQIISTRLLQLQQGVTLKIFTLACGHRAARLPTEPPQKRKSMRCKVCWDSL